MSSSRSPQLNYNQILVLKPTKIPLWSSPHMSPTWGWAPICPWPLFKTKLSSLIGLLIGIWVSSQKAKRSGAFYDRLLNLDSLYGVKGENKTICCCWAQMQEMVQAAGVGDLVGIRGFFPQKACWKFTPFNALKKNCYLKQGNNENVTSHNYWYRKLLPYLQKEIVTTAIIEAMINFHCTNLIMASDS